MDALSAQNYVRGVVLFNPNSALTTNCWEKKYSYKHFEFVDNLVKKQDSHGKDPEE